MICLWRGGDAVSLVPAVRFPDVALEPGLQDSGRLPDLFPPGYPLSPSLALCIRLCAGHEGTAVRRGGLRPSVVLLANEEFMATVDVRGTGTAGVPRLFGFQDAPHGAAFAGGGGGTSTRDSENEVHVPGQDGT